MMLITTLVGAFAPVACLMDSCFSLLSLYLETRNLRFSRFWPFYGVILMHLHTSIKFAPVRIIFSGKGPARLRLPSENSHCTCCDPPIENRASL